jgi:hypothetical protein
MTETKYQNVTSTDHYEAAINAFRKRQHYCHAVPWQCDALGRLKRDG